MELCLPSRKSSLKDPDGLGGDKPKQNDDEQAGKDGGKLQPGPVKADVETKSGVAAEELADHYPYEGTADSQPQAGDDHGECSRQGELEKHVDRAGIERSCASDQYRINALDTGHCIDGYGNNGKEKGQRHNGLHAEAQPDDEQGP